MHIERSLLNEEGTTVGESQSNVEIISIGKPASHRRVEILRLGNTIYFMEKMIRSYFICKFGDLKDLECIHLIFNWYEFKLLI